jgi:hypothetical protein
MASKSATLSVAILAETARLSKGLKDAKSQLGSFQKTVSGTARKVNLALGAIGIGLSVQTLRKLSQAAIDDSKAQKIMANSMINSSNATQQQIKDAEDYIQTLQKQTAILDDDLRPAFSTFYRTTKDLAASQKLLALATDVSAGTGKDLTMVSQALAKAYAGQYASLNKLIPGISKAKNPLQEIEKTFKGLAEAAANEDPFKRIDIILNDIYEVLGVALLPKLVEFSDWLASDEGSQRLNTIIGQLTGIIDLAGKATGGMSDFFAAGKDESWDGGFWSFFPAWWNGVKNDFERLQRIANDQKLDSVERLLRNRNLQTTGSTSQLQNFNLSSYMPSTPKGPSKTTIAKNTLKAAVKTLKTELKSLQESIKEFSDKFRDAVDLSFGIVDTGIRKVFRVDRLVREMRRIKDATKDLVSNLNILRKAGGSAGNSLIEQIIGLPPEEAAVVARGFAQNLGAFQEAIAIGGNLSSTGTTVGQMASQLQGNQTEQQILNEIKLLNKQLANGKNTYNIKSDMTANEIVAAIRKWEKSTGKKVLVA